MKKLAATALTLTMAFAMSTPVYATWNPGDITSLKYNTPIEATYEEGVTTTETVYSVDVEWGNLEYTYHPNATKKWDPDTLKYVVTEGTPSWDCEADADKIKVTNHSNVAISANFAYEQTNTDVKGTFNQTKINLKSADGTEVDEAPMGTATLALSGNMAGDEEGVLGNVKVTIGDFQGEKPSSDVIMSNYISFSTTADDKVMEATGTFSYANPLKLNGLKIGGVLYRLTPSTSSLLVGENKVNEIKLEEATDGKTNNSVCYPSTPENNYDKTNTYKYVLKINIETKTATIAISKIS